MGNKFFYVVLFIALVLFYASSRAEETFPDSQKEETYTISEEELRGPRTAKLTAELNFGNLSWKTNGRELNASALSDLFYKDIDIQTYVIDIFVGYRFNHNRTISSSLGLTYGRGLTDTDIISFGVKSNYRFRSWNGLTYKVVFHTYKDFNLDMVLYTSLIDFRTDNDFRRDNKIESNTLSTFSGWGFGYGFVMGQFHVTYKIYLVEIGTCSVCDRAKISMLTLGWAY